MKTKIRLSIFLFCFGIIAQSQKTTAYFLETGNPNVKLGGELFETSNGRFDFIGTTQFGFDSAYVTMMKLDTGKNILSQTHFRTSGTRHIFFDAEPTGDGYLISSNLPPFIDVYLAKVDTNFNVLWESDFDGMLHSQDVFRILFSEGKDITGYSYSDRPNEAFYRLRINQTGDTFSSREYIPVDSMEFRFYQGQGTGNPHQHILAGKAVFLDSNAEDALISVFDDNGNHWSRAYHFDSQFFEEASSIIPLADGNWLFSSGSFNQDSLKSSTFLTKIDTSGNVIWCQRLSLNGSNANFATMLELVNGDLLIAGFSGNFETTLLKLTSAGSKIWERKYVFSNFGWTGFGHASYAKNGNVILSGTVKDYVLMELDGAGNGCDWIADSTIRCEAFTGHSSVPVLFTSTSISLLEAAIFHFSRNQNHAKTVLCQDTSAGSMISPEYWRQTKLEIYPQPAVDFLKIEWEGESKNAEIQIFDSRGKLELKIEFSKIVKVQNLSSGLKILKIQDSNSAAFQKFIKD